VLGTFFARIPSTRSFEPEYWETRGPVRVLKNRCSTTLDHCKKNSTFQSVKKSTPSLGVGKFNDFKKKQPTITIFLLHLSCLRELSVLMNCFRNPKIEHHNIMLINPILGRLFWLPFWTGLNYAPTTYLTLKPVIVQ